MTAWLRWTAGRQGTGYDKLLLAHARWPLPFDVYLLRYRTGASLPMHTDPVDGRRHYRLNVVLRSARKGGEFLCFQPPVWRSRRQRAVLFRSDTTQHAMTMVNAGTRYVLSVGVALSGRTST